MAKISEIRCNECNKIKDIANRWLLGVRTVHSWADEHSTADFLCPVIALRPWDREMAEAPDVQHFCSDQCALVWQQREIEGMGR